MKKYSDRVENIIDKKEKLVKKRREKMKSFGIVGVSAFLLVSIIGCNIILDKKEIFEPENNEIAKVEILNKFESKEELVSKIKKQYNSRNRIKGLYINDVVETVGAIDDTAQTATSVEENKTFSETNTQVQGVDEADIVKTNGDNIYYLSDNNLNIFDTKTDETKLVKQISFSEDDYVMEMYLDNNYIIVLSNYYKRNDENKSYYGSSSFLKVYVYDINTYDLVKEVETEGYYLSSRKIDNNMYIVTNKSPFSYFYYNDDIKFDDYRLPVYKDSSVSNDYVEIQATDISYFENSKDCTFMMITSFDLRKIQEEINIDTYLGAGDEIYVSKDALYVANIDYRYNTLTGHSSEKTCVHKFEIKDGKTNYIATGKVNGELLNQFSMDEYNGNFRITTTTYGETMKNNLYVLDSNMNVIGSLTGLARGEKIYATRFMGDKCYIVTYKTVDPLFVIDLSNPTSPTVLGELKIPGYSKYLHPIGENYLLGFGEDSVERTYINWNGEEQTTAYANGLKMAIFDVSDYNNPKEISSVKIGGRGSYSELLYNHKALLFDENECIMAFPASLYTDEGFDSSGMPKYGKEEFNGALVYNISIKDGISLRGKISHNANSYRDIERIIRIDNKLYTVSPKTIQSNNIETINTINRLDF